MKLYKIVCPFLCFLLLFGCTRKNGLITTKSSHHEVGETVHELYYDDQYVFNIDFPKTNIEELDRQIEVKIQDLRNQYIQKVNTYQGEQKAELNISYQSYIKDDRYVSIKLDVFQTIYDTTQSVISFCYDLEKERMVGLQDIFKEGIVMYVSQQAKTYFEVNFSKECANAMFKVGIAPSPHNYDTFVMRKDALVFYFQEGEVFETAKIFEVKYEDIYEYSNLKKEDVATFVPYEDILNEQVKHIDNNKAMVALTFDDGPTPEYTNAILDALTEYNASATFFVLGSRANKFPEVLQRMILEGHEIGNHTFSHKQLTTLSKANIEEEIAMAQETIHNVTNKYPNIIRPPYGSKNDTVLQCAQDKKIVTWSIDTEDWRSKDTKKIIDKVIDNVEDGSIILMHDVYASSAQAAVLLIPKLQEMGYQLVTVSQLNAAGKAPYGKIL